MIRVLFTWERRPAQPVAEALRRTISATVARLGVDDAEVHVLLTGDDRVRELNRSYRDRDSSTDVLSFPDGDRLPNGRTLLGQIVISLDTARRQARQAGLSEERELQELVIHGTLHLLGYDHSTDDGAMDATELRLREELAR